MGMGMNGSCSLTEFKPILATTSRSNSPRADGSPQLVRPGAHSIDVSRYPTSGEWAQLAKINEFMGMGPSPLSYLAVAASYMLARKRRHERIIYITNDQRTSQPKSSNLIPASKKDIKCALQMRQRRSEERRRVNLTLDSLSIIYTSVRTPSTDLRVKFSNVEAIHAQTDTRFARTTCCGPHGATPKADQSKLRGAPWTSVILLPVGNEVAGCSLTTEDTTH